MGTGNERPNPASSPSWGTLERSGVKLPPWGIFEILVPLHRKCSSVGQIYLQIQNLRYDPRGAISSQNIHLHAHFCRRLIDPRHVFPKLFTYVRLAHRLLHGHRASATAPRKKTIRFVHRRAAPHAHRVLLRGRRPDARASWCDRNSVERAPGYR